MKDATFLVTAADEESAVLRDVTDSQVHTLTANPGVDVGEVLTASIEPDPPMEVAWRVVEIADRRTIPVEKSPEPPTKQAVEIAADQPVGEITRRERAGEGELHVVTVPEGEADDAAADVLDDEETLARAARLGVERVEIRADGQTLSVRYLP